jgi:hypothetical protein
VKQHRAEGYGLDLSDLPKSKPDAERVGATYFYTGRPCSKGHLAARYTKGGNCSYCSRSYGATRRGSEFNGQTSKALANAARGAANAAGSKTYISPKPCGLGHTLRWVASTNCIECDRLKRTTYKENRKNNRVKNLYGLDAEAHETMFQGQCCACAICNTEFKHRRLMHIDHCHQTNVVRGLLCGPCNQGIGLLKHDPEILKKAMEYINDHA